jgi:hypothetical protein
MDWDLSRIGLETSTYTSNAESVAALLSKSYLHADEVSAVSG